MGYKLVVHIIECGISQRPNRVQRQFTSRGDAAATESHEKRTLYAQNNYQHY
jgi:hypothetical protein